MITPAQVSPFDQQTSYLDCCESVFGSSANLSSNRNYFSMLLILKHLLKMSLYMYVLNSFSQSIRSTKIKIIIIGYTDKGNNFDLEILLRLLLTWHNIGIWFSIRSSICLLLHQSISICVSPKFDPLFPKNCKGYSDDPLYKLALRDDN